MSSWRRDEPTNVLRLKPNNSQKCRRNESQPSTIWCSKRFGCRLNELQVVMVEEELLTDLAQEQFGSVNRYFIAYILIILYS